MDTPWPERRLAWGLLASLLLHWMALSMLRTPGLTPALPASLRPIEVDLAPLPPPARARPPAALPAPAQPEQPEQAPPQEPNLALPERQIVAPPDAGEEQPPEQTRLLSDRDNRVREEMVQRAERYQEKRAAKAEGAPAKRSHVVDPSETAGRQRRREKAETAPSAAGEQVAALPKLEQLLPSLGDVAVSAPTRPTPAGGAEAETEARPARRLLLDSGGPAFSVHPGTADFLPGIREGNITLLNTKAERFAPFVRRVAARVFQHLDIRLRQTARAGVASPGREYAVVEAVMDRQGRLVRARVVERQSTSTFGADRVLLAVTTPETFFDANPPPGAEASDGHIHFLLLIDLDVVAVPDPRTGRVAVGYRGIAGVGLDALADRRQ